MFDIHLSPIKIALNYDGQDKNIEGELHLLCNGQSIEIEVSYGTARAILRDCQGREISVKDMDMPEGADLGTNLRLLELLAREIVSPLA